MIDTPYVGDLRAGNIVRWTAQDPLVEIIRVKKDRYGFDVLYGPQNGNVPRWRGFDLTDRVIRERENQ